MPGKKSQKKSKRMTLKLKYKIDKKVKEHHRKLKRECKKKKGHIKRKDPGVPNSAPFKAQLIHEAQAYLAAKEEKKKEMIRNLKLQRKLARDEVFNTKRSLQEVLQDAQKRGEEFDEINDVDSEMTFSDSSAKAYCKEFKKVLSSADVILEVLDARDPQGTRCPSIEETIQSDPNKRLVLVLNKADLVPRESLEAWLKYLRREFPTLIFKASTQKQAKNLSHVKAKVFKTERMYNSGGCIGADSLMQLLKNYCRNCGIKTTISVGVIGLPNVGKSSLINSLKRTKACNVGATPGITRSIQEVILDSKVHLIDCPGVILPEENSSDAASCLRNAFKVDSLLDPLSPVDEIINRVGKERMRQEYALSEFQDTNEFLALVAKKAGRLSKGGIPNFEEAARMILKDWNAGKIKYYTLPPAVTEMTESNAVFLNKMSKEFSLDDFETDAADILDSLPTKDDMDTVQVNSWTPLSSLSHKSHPDKEVVPMEDDTEETDEKTSNILPKNVRFDLPQKSTSEKGQSVKVPQQETITQDIDWSTADLSKIQKKMSKKMNRDKRRNDRMAEELTKLFASFSALKENKDYDFDEYFSPEK